MKSKKKVRVLTPHVLLTYLMVITFVLTGVSFARFGTTKTAEDAANSAVFDVTISKAAGTVNQYVYLKSDTDAPATQQQGYLEFEVTSTSEVPVTYDIKITAPSGAALQDGVEWFLTPLDPTADDYSTRRANAIAGHKYASAHTHRPNGSTTVTFTGCGIAPAGTYTQHYVLNMHYETKDNEPNTGIYNFTGMITERVSGIQITATARDARNNATTNSNTGVVTKYNSPYTAE